jgi:DNA-binding Lrp family transcriptional regulator
VSNDIRLDSIDREILFQLGRDGRLSNVDLAARVGLTPPPCLRRVRRLEEAGVITGFRAVLDPAALGRGLEVILDIDITASDRSTIEDFEAAMSSYDEVIELRRMFGQTDYFARVAVADQVAYETFLTTKLIGLPAIQRIVSRLTMKMIKADH